MDTNDSILELAEKLKNGTASKEEKLAYLKELNKILKELKNELERIFYSRGIYVENVLLSEISSIAEMKNAGKSVAEGE